MQAPFIRWANTVNLLRERTPKFKTVEKKHLWTAKTINFIVFWTSYMLVFTTRWPNVYLPDRPIEQQQNPRVLQHEGVHLWDQETFFGLLPFLHPWINLVLFLIAYGIPQVFAVLAFGAFFNPWWLLALLFLLPLPAPFRAWAEMRAYRRSYETGLDLEHIVVQFTGKSYLFMWPFKKHVQKLALKPSPYKEEMDAAWALPQ